jgi:hypothetical protein
MNEFLLLALVIVYMVISYVPISDAHKGHAENRRSRQSSANTKNDTDIRS